MWPFGTWGRKEPRHIAVRIEVGKGSRDRWRWFARRQSDDTLVAQSPVRGYAHAHEARAMAVALFPQADIRMKSNEPSTGGHHE